MIVEYPNSSTLEDLRHRRMFVAAVLVVDLS
jgi:hypothetical protein